MCNRFGGRGKGACNLKLRTVKKIGRTGISLIKKNALLNRNVIPSMGTFSKSQCKIYTLEKEKKMDVSENP
jgi:hypothetical protein